MVGCVDFDVLFSSFWFWVAFAFVGFQFGSCKCGSFLFFRIDLRSLCFGFWLFDMEEVMVFVWWMLGFCCIAFWGCFWHLFMASFLVMKVGSFVGKHVQAKGLGKPPKRLHLLWANSNWASPFESLQNNPWTWWLGFKHRFCCLKCRVTGKLNQNDRDPLNKAVDKGKLNRS